MSSFRDYKPLRLMAGDAEDLNVISAMFQDAVVKVGDFAYLPQERRFALVANRFLWENAGTKRHGVFARVRAGLHFNDVKAAQHLNIRTNANDAVVELLSIRFEPAEDAAGTIILDFAGGGAIQLGVESVNAEMRDMSAPWRTSNKPEHDTAGEK